MAPLVLSGTLSAVDRGSATFSTHALPEIIFPLVRGLHVMCMFLVFVRVCFEGHWVCLKACSIYMGHVV
jgi:hypothetical protein